MQHIGNIYWAGIYIIEWQVETYLLQGGYNNNGSKAVISV